MTGRWAGSAGSNMRRRRSYASAWCPAPGSSSPSRTWASRLGGNPLAPVTAQADAYRSPRGADRVALAALDAPAHGGNLVASRTRRRAPRRRIPRARGPLHCQPLRARLAPRAVHGRGAARADSDQRRRTSRAKSSRVLARRSVVVSSRFVIGISPYCAVSFRLISSSSALAARSPSTIWRRRAAASW